MACEPKKCFDSRESVGFPELIPVRCGTSKGRLEDMR